MPTTKETGRNNARLNSIARNYNNELTTERLKNVKLPPKTKCSACKKIKQLAQFSNKQLNDLRFKVYQSGGQEGCIPSDGAIRCRACTGAQNTEMACIQCGEDKALDHFSLNQRKKKDLAVCLLCMEDLDNLGNEERSIITTESHDGSVASESVVDESESNYGDTYKWDRETGNYATSTGGGDKSKGGVPVATGESSKFDRPRPSVTTAKADVPGKIGLTTSNLAKLSIGDDLPKPAPSIAGSSIGASSASKWNTFAMRESGARARDGSYAADCIPATASGAMPKSFAAPDGGVWLNQARRAKAAPSTVAGSSLYSQSEDDGEEADSVAGVYNGAAPSTAGGMPQSFNPKDKGPSVKSSASSASRASSVEVVTNNAAAYGNESSARSRVEDERSARFPRVRPTQAPKTGWRGERLSKLEEIISSEPAPLPTNAAVMEPDSDDDDD